MDNSGCIHIKEMIEYLDSVCDDIDEKNVREIFAKLDVTGDRNIDFWEFEVTEFQALCESFQGLTSLTQANFPKFWTPLNKQNKHGLSPPPFPI